MRRGSPVAISPPAACFAIEHATACCGVRCPAAISPQGSGDGDNLYFANSSICQISGLVTLPCDGAFSVRPVGFPARIPVLETGPFVALTDGPRRRTPSSLRRTLHLDAVRGALRTWLSAVPHREVVFVRQGRAPGRQNQHQGAQHNKKVAHQNLLLTPSVQLWPLIPHHKLSVQHESYFLEGRSPAGSAALALCLRAVLRPVVHHGAALGEVVGAEVCLLNRVADCVGQRCLGDFASTSVRLPSHGVCCETRGRWHRRQDREAAGPELGKSAACRSAMETPRCWMRASMPL